MRRRELLALVGGLLALGPRPMRAQQSRLVGVLWLDKPEIAKAPDAALRQGLAAAGFVEGPSLAFAERNANGDLSRLPALAGELAALHPSVIVAAGSVGALAAHRAAPDTPVAAPLDGDPVALVLFHSYAHPDNMVTGFTLTASTAQVGKSLQILRDIKPDLRGVSFVFSPDIPGAVRLDSTVQAAASDLGLTYAAFPVKSMDDVKIAFASPEAEGMLIYGSPLLRQNAAAFVDLAIANRKLVITIFRDLTEKGFLMSYGLDRMDMWHGIGGYAAKVLAGAKPADLPVQEPTKFELVINLKTAKALGLTIPSTLLQQADDVIE